MFQKQTFCVSNGHSPQIRENGELLVRVSHISENGRFGKYSHSPKTASFARVLEFAKFAGE